MSILSRMRSILGRKISAAGSLVSFNKVGQPVWTPRDYANMSERAYQKCVASFRCVNIVSKGFAKVPLCLYRGDDEIEGPELRNHKLWQLLHKPNPWQAGSVFFQGVAAYYMLNGNSPIEGVVGDFTPKPMGKGRPPDQLFSLRPDRMTIVASSVGTPAGFVYKVANQTPRTWDADPFTGDSGVMWWKSFHPLNDWYGMGAVEAAMWSVDSHTEASAHNKALLQNSGTPSGALVYSPKGNEGAILTEQQYKRLKEEIDETISGPRNAGRPMLLDGGLTWQAMGLSPREMDWLEGKNVSTREICNAFGVPPFLLGAADTTFNNYAEARQALYEDTVLPLLDDFLDFLNMKLVPLYGETDLRVGYDEANIAALEPKRAAKWAAIAGSNWLTTNEKRDATDYDQRPEEEADMILVPSTLTPLEGIADAPDPNADPALGGEDGAEPAPGAKPKKPSADSGKRMIADRRMAERMVRREMNGHGRL